MRNLPTRSSRLGGAVWMVRRGAGNTKSNGWWFEDGASTMVAQRWYFKEHCSSMHDAGMVLQACLTRAC